MDLPTETQLNLARCPSSSSQGPPKRTPTRSPLKETPARHCATHEKNHSSRGYRLHLFEKTKHSLAARISTLKPLVEGVDVYGPHDPALHLEAKTLTIYGNALATRHYTPYSSLFRCPENPLNPCRFIRLTCVRADPFKFENPKKENGRRDTVVQNGHYPSHQKAWGQRTSASGEDTPGLKSEALGGSALPSPSPCRGLHTS
ncbi:hypothetical protein GWK47_025693 [Chionoecetes opilio]|uniref:Uncharacterized protein n=1 Tax=Chionoecetes opilio TaxID=41210 RepID=A0A8J8WN54_CHIOP|nr:hypothetical protein GWK47_025693 [Chionoecetes opilio]